MKSIKLKGRITMLEQSELNGAVYNTYEKLENGKMKLITSSVSLNTVTFGKPEKIIIHRKLGMDEILVERPALKAYAVYLHNKFMYVVEPSEEDLQGDELFYYNYGTAIIDGKETPYLIQNDPPVGCDLLPNYKEFHLPPVLSGYPYDRTFTYEKVLIALLGSLPATYTDRYKRPINAGAIKYQKYYPVTIDNVKTKFYQLANTEEPFPIVVLLNSQSNPTPYACIDLEPGYTKEELDIAESFDAYYKEDTPRGGKHYLVRVSLDNDVFKYRISEHLEVQVNCQITFYGINGIMLNKNPTETDFSNYTIVGHNTIAIDNTSYPDGVSELVAELEEANKRLGTTGKSTALRQYDIDSDESHADFVAMLRLYNIDIKPFIKEIPENMLPWVLAEYTSNIIPARLKHIDNRQGVPYLVYLALKIIKNREGIISD